MNPRQSTIRTLCKMFAHSVWVLLAAVAMADPQYQIYDLGLVQVDHPASFGYGISSGGMALGCGLLGDAQESTGSQAFIWTQDDGLVGLPNLAGRNFCLSKSANGGIVVGSCPTSASPNLGYELPVIWKHGMVSQLPLPTGYTIGAAHSINASGIAVGSVGSVGSQRGVIYTGNKVGIINQTAPGGIFFTVAYGINDSGRIAGRGSDNLGIVHDTTTNTTFSIGAFQGAGNSIAYGVNNSGVVVGWSFPFPPAHLVGLPFVWSEATGMVAIPVVQGTEGGGGQAVGVNSDGWVVGKSSTDPFLFDGTNVYRLADLLPDGSGWNLSTASGSLGISDNGTIVGTGRHNNQTRAYAMVPVQSTPTPTPTGTPSPKPFPTTTHFVISASVSSGIGSPISISVSARDQFNHTAVDYSGRVRFSSTSSGTLPANTTLTNGTAFFVVTLNTPGNQTITATDLSDSSIAGTSNPVFVPPTQPTPPPRATATATATAAPPTPTATATATATGTPTPTSTPIGPDRILFDSNRDGNDEIYRMETNGVNAVRITNNPASDQNPRLSPNGTKIAFDSNRTGFTEIYVMNVDGTNPVRLTFTNGNFWPNWSPDGTKIAFSSIRDDLFQVYVMNANGTNQVPLTGGDADNSFGSWSPDGSKIAFMTYRDGDGEVYVMDSNGANQTNLTNYHQARDLFPAWSPDGTKIAYDRDFDSGFRQICVMNTDGSNQIVLTDGAFDFVPAWSPDGSKIAFCRRQNDLIDIYVMNADGSNPVRLTDHSANNQSPNWGIPVFGTPSPTPTATPTATATASPPPPSLGNYPNVSVPLSTNTTVMPDAVPTNSTSINVSTSTSFKGTLEAYPATGIVRITDAHPSGTYTVTITAFNPIGLTTIKTLTLTVTTPPICPSVAFGAPASYTTAPGSESVAVGDFNGDSKQDLAVANDQANNVSVLLGDGAGHFGPRSNYPVGSYPGFVTVSDFNGDGKQDLVAANFQSANVSILLGNGAGGFGGPTNFNAGGVPVDIAVGDFNSDGKRDLAVVNSNSSVSILFGDGGGNFGSPTTINIFGAGSVAAGDFNGDGNQDLAVAAGTSGVAICLGDGAGHFSAPTFFPAGNTARLIKVGDFNNDGRQDLAVGNSNTASVILGDGIGGFGSATTFGSGGPNDVVVGDFNSDGNQDVAFVSNNGFSGVSIWSGDGAGHFNGPSQFTVVLSPYALAVGDFNGDGRQDLATANIGSGNASILLNACPAPSPTPSPTQTPTATATPTPCLPLITQSSSQAITVANSASCNDGNTHTDNSYWRAFDMTTYAGGGQYCINSVSFGVEFANTTQPVTVRLYTTSNFPIGFPGSLTQIATTTVNVGSGQNGTVVTTPLTVMVPAGTPQLVMELFTPNGQPGGYRFFVGSNAALETGSSYFSAPACGITTPITTAILGFPNMHIVFDINGTCTCAAPTPTPCPLFNISGTVGQCTTAGPSGVALAGVTITRTGGQTWTTTTDSSGFYYVDVLQCSNPFIITPSKATRPPGSTGIDTVDVIAVQRHFLALGTPLTGCRLTAADCAAPHGISTIDVIAIQRFFLEQTTGIGSVGQYSFTPPNRSWSTIFVNQTGQNFDTIVFGDVASPYAVP